MRVLAEAAGPDSVAVRVVRARRRLHHEHPLEPIYRRWRPPELFAVGADATTDRGCTARAARPSVVTKRRTPLSLCLWQARGSATVTAVRPRHIAHLPVRKDAFVRRVVRAAQARKR